MSVAIEIAILRDHPSVAIVIAPKIACIRFMPRVPKPFPLTMAAASPLPDIGPRGGGDDGPRGGGDSESECSTTWLTQLSCAETNASGIRGDPDEHVAREKGPLELKPAPGLSCGWETQDGVMEDSDPQEQRGPPGKFGVLCGNWGGATGMRRPCKIIWILI